MVDKFYKVAIIAPRGWSLDQRGWWIKPGRTREVIHPSTGKNVPAEWFTLDLAYENEMANAKEGVQQ